MDTLKKYLVKFKLRNKRKQKTVNAKDIYDAERIVRKENNAEYSDDFEVLTIKCGIKLYYVYGSTL